MRSKPRWIFGAIAIGVIVLMTFLTAPANNKLTSGSTYNRAPNGYGAWYAFMSQRGTPVNRWRKPFEELIDNQDVESPITFLRVNSNLTREALFQKELDWVGRGNTFVVLGVYQPVTAAPFRTTHQAGTQRIKIDTQRRDKDEQEPLLGDRFGAIVWEKKYGKGQVIYATTPHLAANAYQDFQGNYEFLAQLVSRQGVRSQESGVRSQELGVRSQELEEFRLQNSIWVDEYIHGYKDAEVIKREHRQDLVSYLAKTPVFPALVQGFILLLVAIWAGNQRFGKPLTLSAPVVDNSEAYIQALAGVLQKANSSEFILEVVGKEEQLQLQKALVLGEVPLDHQSLVDAWVQQTGRSATELEQLLQMPARKHRISETDLLTWLDKWAQIRRHLPSYQTDK